MPKGLAKDRALDERATPAKAAVAHEEADRDVLGHFVDFAESGDVLVFDAPYPHSHGGPRRPGHGAARRDVAPRLELLRRRQGLLCPVGERGGMVAPVSRRRRRWREARAPTQDTTKRGNCGS